MSEHASPEFSASLSLLSDTQNAIFFVADKSYKGQLKEYEPLLGSMTALHVAAFQQAVEAVLQEKIFINSISKAAVIASLFEHASSRRAKVFNIILEVDGFGLDHEPEDPYELKEYLDNITQTGASVPAIASRITRSFRASFQSDIDKAYGLLNPPEETA